MPVAAANPTTGPPIHPHGNKYSLTLWRTVANGRHKQIPIANETRKSRSKPSQRRRTKLPTFGSQAASLVLFLAVSIQHTRFHQQRMLLGTKPTGPRCLTRISANSIIEYCRRNRQVHFRASFSPGWSGSIRGRISICGTPALVGTFFDSPAGGGWATLEGMVCTAHHSRSSFVLRSPNPQFPISNRQYQHERSRRRFAIS